MHDNHQSWEGAFPINQSPAREHHIASLATIGFLSYSFITMWHELIGHGLTMYFFGARSFVLTSTTIDAADFDISRIPLQEALIAMNGSLFNLFIGVILFFVLRIAIQNRWSITWRFLLWNVAFNSMFHCFSYIFFSGLVGVGDWLIAIRNLPNQTLIRIGEVIFGSVTCLLTAKVAGKYLLHMVGNCWRLTLVPYFSTILIFIAIGLRIPGTYFLIFSVIPAAMLGQGVLPLAPMVTKNNSKISPDPEIISMNWPLIAFAVIILAVLTYIAPGYKFTVG
jgi:hypothetical protein